MKKFKQYEAVVFDPKWVDKYPLSDNHPLQLRELVYFLGLIPNVPGHCIVATEEGKIVPMIHPEDLRPAKDCEL